MLTFQMLFLIKTKKSIFGGETWLNKNLYFIHSAFTVVGFILAAAMVESF